MSPAHHSTLGRLMAEYLPGYDVRTVDMLGGGLDNVVYQVNGELLIRFSKEPDPTARARQVLREATVLREVAGHVSVAVPRPVLVEPEQGCLGYFMLPGVALIDVPLTERRSTSIQTAATLGGILRAMHATPIERFDGLVEVDHTTPAEWLARATDHYSGLAAHLPAGHRTSVERFLTQPAPNVADRLTFSHHDLGIEHVLIEPATGVVTGVIDWTDAAVVDAAFDFGLICRDLGSDALDRALDNYRAESPAACDVIRERATFYARCSVLEDLALGLETGRRPYVDKCLDSLRWLFAPPLHTPPRE